MKQQLKFGQYLTIASMLFGLFFGAGNLIFPVHMGQMAGSNVWSAILGFLVTGVGLPLLGVTALGISRCSGLAELSGRIGSRYSILFTCALYLTIGPFFAIPRCATVPFTVGIIPLLTSGTTGALPRAAFSFLFFAVVLWFSLRPNGILTWIGKVLNPIFLACLGILVVTALLNPLGHVGDITPADAYASGAFFNGFLEGYNTMDALAGLAFGIIVVNVVHSLGVNEPEAVARSTVKAGVFSSIIMAAIYLAVTVVGTQSRGVYPIGANGGETLTVIAHHYFGTAGFIILAGTVTFACLKTAVGLITSCAETFSTIFPHSLNYRHWAMVFCAVSFFIANLGLDAIIAYSLPVLMFLYPLAITLILLTLCGRLFGHDLGVYRWVTVFTLIASSFDCIKALPPETKNFLHLNEAVGVAERFLPLFHQGLGWVVPALAGCAIGLLLYFRKLSSHP